MIEYRQGDLLKAPMDIIVHGCNCKHSFGAGIARQIREQFPQAHTADLKTLYGDPSKLGDYSTVVIDNKRIINAYTQFNYSTDKLDVDYDAVERVMRTIKVEYSVDAKLGMPRIGCGLAGGDWNKVEEILNRVFNDRTIYVYDYGFPDWVNTADGWIQLEKQTTRGTWNVSMEN